VQTPTGADVKVDQAAAEAACASLGPEEKEGCIYDMQAANDPAAVADIASEFTQVQADGAKLEAEAEAENAIPSPVPTPLPTPTPTPTPASTTTPVGAGGAGGAAGGAGATGSAGGAAGGAGAATTIPATVAATTTLPATVAATTTAVAFVATTFPEGELLDGLQADAPAGTTTLVVQHHHIYTKGQAICIDEGTPIAECNTVVGYGTLKLKTPLTFTHKATAKIHAMKIGHKITTTTLSPTVCADDPTWIDSAHGQGGAKCNSGAMGGIVKNPSWCKGLGDYSTEVSKACPAACGLCQGPVITRLEKAANKGDMVIEVQKDKEPSLLVGTKILIDYGSANVEEGVIVGKGTIILKNALTKAHSLFAPVVAQAAEKGTTTPIITQTTTPAAKYEPVQQQFASVRSPLLVIGLFVGGAIIAFWRSQRNSRDSRTFTALVETDVEDCLAE
jgi:hypothetical protein